MKKRSIKIVWLAFLTMALLSAFALRPFETTHEFLSYIVDLKKDELKFYWKNEKGEIIGNFANLKTVVESKNKKLEFAMNGGMYMQDQSPLGLYIEEGKMIRPLSTRSGSGNFYLDPNGVFYVTSTQEAMVCKTGDFIAGPKIKYATQSGPMLVVDGQINPVFKQGSANLNIRNGVGILPDGKVLFAISNTGVNFYDFAAYFKKAGCRNALYLDGFVSRMYLPSKKIIQTDGGFGVMIGVVKPKVK
jgi:uncharacterized protein YigE (DUF2233 family)